MKPGGMGFPEEKDKLPPLPPKKWRRNKRGKRRKRSRIERYPWAVEMRKLPCHYCGEPGGTVDHKIPRSKKGLTTPENCVPCCSPCNTFRRNMPYEEFLIRWKERRFR
jgi:5-methylcytosine-specific restriction endonuclease McrA